MNVGSFEDEFGGADPKGYVETEVIDGRAVILFANERRTMKSKTDAGGTYEAVFADVIVLDGKLDPDNGIDAIPAVIENMMFRGQIVGATRSKVGKLKPTLGRINSRPSSFNKRIPVYGIAELTAQEKSQIGDLAVKAKRDYLAARQADEFASPQTHDDPPPF
jgi:hypothetical protein